jgi:hypothetical protein
MKALAYLNYGRWVADCPQCNDARLVYHPDTGERQSTDRCINGHLIEFEMPSPGAERALTEALDGRREATKTWHPPGHARAEAAGLPVGEPVQNVRARTEAEIAEAQSEQEERAELLATLERLGVQVGRDGSFSGRVDRGGPPEPGHSGGGQPGSGR